MHKKGVMLSDINLDGKENQSRFFISLESSRSTNHPQDCNANSLVLREEVKLIFLTSNGKDFTKIEICRCESICMTLQK